MKSLISFVVVLCLASVAKAAAPTNPLYSQPNANPIPLQNLVFYGGTAYHVDASTPAATPVLLAAGSGFLYGVACSSGTSGDLGRAFDSASSSGLTLTTSGKSLSPDVLASAGPTACTGQATCGQWAPPSGAVRFKNGLAFLKAGSAYENCTAYALTDAEIAAGSH